MKERLLLFFKRENSIRGATGILAITLLLSNILGVIRDHFLAQKIPASTLDIYYTAFRWPDLLFNIIILGAVSSAFIPIFTSVLEEDESVAVGIANTLMGVLVAILIGIVLVFALSMPWLVRLTAPGFPPDKLSMTVGIARLLLIGPFFFCLSYIFSGMLQSWQRFLIPSFSPLVYNVSIIGGTIVFADRFGVVGVAWGVIIGSVLHALIQVPPLLNLGWRLTQFASLKDERIVKIFRLMIPRAVGLAANQILLLSFTSIASTISAGAIALYNLADNIQTTPTVIVAHSVAGALFPTLSKVHAKGGGREFSRYLEQSIVVVLFFLIPMACGTILLRTQVVRIILGSGFFGWKETVRAAAALGGFAIGIPFAGLVPLLARAYYARQNTVVPTVITIFGSLISIVIGYFLAHRFDVMGLAIAFSVGNLTNALILYLTIRKFVSIPLHSLLAQLIKITAGSLIMSVAIQLAKSVTGYYWPLTTGLAVLHQIVVAGGVGIIVYFSFMKVAHFDFVWLKKR